jgi:hypothetical protein
VLPFIGRQHMGQQVQFPKRASRRLSAS